MLGDARDTHSTGEQDCSHAKSSRWDIQHALRCETHGQPAIHRPSKHVTHLSWLQRKRTRWKLERTAQPEWPTKPQGPRPVHVGITVSAARYMRRPTTHLATNCGNGKASHRHVHECTPNVAQVAETGHQRYGVEGVITSEKRWKHLHVCQHQPHGNR